MQSQQAIQNPFGVTVFGSALNRVSPDIASILCAVSRLEQTANKAFEKARQGSKSVQEYLHKAQVREFGASRITLAQQNRFLNGESKFAGYLAKVSFRVVLADLERVDEVVGALVEAGANEITNVTFETSLLKEVRAEARRMAIYAAHEKAQVYCSAAEVSLGKVLHIEDANPQQLQLIGEATRGPASGQEEGSGAFDPSKIAVAANVFVAYEIMSNSGSKNA
jgi:uncharacterized protein YggE